MILLAYALAVATAACDWDSALAADGGVGGWSVVAHNDVRPRWPYTYVSVDAWFGYVPNQSEVFGRARVTLHATEAMFVEPHAGFNPAIGAEAHRNLVWEGTRVRGIELAQLHMPPWFPGNPANPIFAFEVRWGTDVFAPRDVRVRTETLLFEVYDNAVPFPALHPVVRVVEGSAIVRVRPDCAPDCDSSTGRGVLDIGTSEKPRRGRCAKNRSSSSCV